MGENLTTVGVDVEPRRDAVAVHDAVLDLAVDPSVGVLGLDLQHKGASGLVLQNHSGSAVVLTLGWIQETGKNNRVCAVLRYCYHGVINTRTRIDDANTQSFIKQLYIIY